VFEIERIFPNSAVQCIAVYTGNDESLWQLSQKHIVLNVFKGFTARKKLTALSKWVQMMGKLHLDLFCQDKYLLNQVDLKIKLRRSRDAFALVADAANYKIKIKEMALYVRKVQLSPAFRMGHVKALEKTSCKYPVRRVEVKVDTVPTGNMNYVQDNMFLGQLPKRLVIACIDSDALNGAIAISLILIL
jgi:hypothetical protein